MESLPRSERLRGTGILFPILVLLAGLRTSTCHAQRRGLPLPTSYSRVVMRSGSVTPDVHYNRVTLHPPSPSSWPPPSLPLPITPQHHQILQPPEDHQHHTFHHQHPKSSLVHLLLPKTVTVVHHHLVHHVASSSSANAHHSHPQLTQAITTTQRPLFTTLQPSSTTSLLPRLNITEAPPTTSFPVFISTPVSTSTSTTSSTTTPAPTSTTSTTTFAPSTPRATRQRITTTTTLSPPFSSAENWELCAGPCSHEDDGSDEEAHVEGPFHVPELHLYPFPFGGY